MSRSEPSHDQESAPPPRLDSVDALRGLVILLMVFVNDLGSSAPAFLLHIQPPDADGMTLADLVFPAFLFIVGLSVPLAFERAREKGVPARTQWLHLFTRFGGLILMGIIERNKAADTTLGNPTWGLLGYVCILLAWCAIPRPGTPGRRVFQVMKWLGIVGIILLLAIFRREPVATEVLFMGSVEQWVWLRTEWWGILGLIGWAYLVAGSIYLLIGQRREWLMAAMLLLWVLYVGLTGDGLFARVDSKPWLGPLAYLVNCCRTVIEFADQWIGLSGGPTALAAISVGGCLLGTTLVGPCSLVAPKERMRWAVSYAGLLFATGLVFDGFAGVNKIAATPTWCAWSAAITCVVWTAIYYFMDVNTTSRWAWFLRPTLVKPAGANPLIAYLLHPIILFTTSLTGLSFLFSYRQSEHVWVVVSGSLLMAAFVCALTAIIARSGFRIRI